jgi:lysophospholipase L1-like esterase
VNTEAVSERTTRRPGRRFIVWTLVGSLAISLVAAELLLRRLAPIPDPYARYKEHPSRSQPIARAHPRNFSFETEVEPGLPGMAPGRHHFTTDNVGFRGDFMPRPKPANEYRIVIVGASTTENFYLDDRENVTSVLQRELNRQTPRSKEYRVYGAGQSGDVTADHIAMISQRIVHLEPDMIILFCGINDLTFAIYHLDYSFLDTTIMRYSLRDFVAFAATEFQLPRYVHAAAQKIRKNDRATLEEMTMRSNYRARVALRKQAPLEKERPRTDLPSYETNLRSIVGLAQAQGIKLVFITQASSWNSRTDSGVADWHWMTLRDGVQYSEEWMDEALENYNEVMRRLGKQNRIPVFPLSTTMPKSREFFYDDCHFNVAGARRMGRELGEFILAQLSGG